MKRSYNVDCPVARTLEVLGERWSALILRDLLLKGRCRFQELQESLSGIPPNTLSKRLRELERDGIVATRLYSEHPPRLEYFLTERGKSLGPVLKALRDWGRLHGSASARR